MVEHVTRASLLVGCVLSNSGCSKNGDEGSDTTGTTNEATADTGPFGQLGEPCGVTSGPCIDGLVCLTGHPVESLPCLYTCVVPCSSDSDCPTGWHCSESGDPDYCDWDDYTY